MIRTTWVLARHDLRLVLSDRGAVLWMLVLPVVFATFFGLVNGAGSDAPVIGRAALTIVDRDGSELSRAFVADLTAARLTVLAPGEEGSDLRTLTIPAGFQQHVAAGERVALQLDKQADASVEASLLAEARITAAITRLLARLARERLGMADAGEASDVVRVESRYAGRARRPPGGFQQSIPGMAVMFVMLVALTYGAASVSAARERGLLRRLATTPIRRVELVLATIAGRFVVAVVQISVLVGVGLAAHLAFGVALGDRPWLLWAVLVVYALAVAPLGVALGAVIRDPDRAASSGVLATMIMAALGGCWWPLEVVPPTFKAIAKLFPTGWAMTALQDVISFGHGPAAVLPELGALLLFAAAATAVAVRRLQVA